MHIHVYTPMRKQCTLAHTYVYHLSAPPFVVSKLYNPWVGTISCDVDHVSSRVASASFHPVPFSIQLLCTHTHTHTHKSSSITLALPPCSPFTSLFSSPLSHSPRSTVSQWRSAPTSLTAVPASQMEACCVAGAVWRTSAPGDHSVPTATVLMV